MTVENKNAEKIKSMTGLDNLSEGDIVLAANKGEMFYTQKGYSKELPRRQSPHRILAAKVSGDRRFGVNFKKD